MKKLFEDLRQRDWFYAALLLISAALAYLLLANRLGLYGDDWYLIFDAHTQGAKFLHVVYASDRPLRAYLLIYWYRLFGDQLIYYHWTAYLFRVLSALAFYWTLNRVWAGRKTAHFLMALIFVLYPGFLNQLQPVDYQSQIVSLGLAMLSIALTVEAVRAKSGLWKILLTVAAIGLAPIYLGLVEYFIGFEFLRLLFVALLVWPEALGSWRQKALRVLLRWLPSVVGPGGFLVWRLFFFKSTRTATDVGQQLGLFLASPWLVGAHWLVSMLYGLIYTPFSAWFVPFYNVIVHNEFRLRDTLLFLGVAAGATALVLAGVWFRRGRDRDDPADAGWIPLTLAYGSAALLAGLAPVILANRTVDFDNSRYTLAGVPGAAMLLVAGLYALKPRFLRVGLTGLMVFLAVAMHVGNAIDLAYQADSLRSFWWQVSWRAPSIEAGTNLLAAYSHMQVPESYDIWAPANLIYYPEKQDRHQVKVKLPASLLSQETVSAILAGDRGHDTEQRGNFLHEDLSLLLVMTQPSPASCVRILDGSNPELSPQDPTEVMLAAPYSLIGNVNLAAVPPAPPTAIFGPEPKHTWCYYYEKAALAGQFGDWATVEALETQAAAAGYLPTDPVEWLPFLRADAVTGNLDGLQQKVVLVRGDPLVRQEACRILSKTSVADPSTQDYIQSMLCY